MIIKQQHSGFSASFTDAWILPATILSLLGVVLLLSWPSTPPVPESLPNEIRCGAETQEISSEGNLPVFVAQNGVRLDNGQTQSDEKARTGDYACRLDAQQPYGMTVRYLDVKPGEEFEVTVWRHEKMPAKSELVAHLVANDGGGFFRVKKTATATEEGGWEQLRLHFSIPVEFPGGELKIYPHYAGEGVAYLDDLHIIRSYHLDSVAANTQLPKLVLEVSPRQWQKLADKRQEALDEGLLTQGPDDWAKGNLLQPDGTKMPLRLRLKGDLSDHFRGNKWSFRVKMKAPNTWNRLVTFSLHTPVARDYLQEYVYHRMVQQEGGLAPRYGFVHLVINGRSLGLYAWEEHFQKQLLESQNRREGPIMKFDETGVWEVRKQASHLGMDWGEMERLHKSFDKADVIPFQAEKTATDPTLSRQLAQAQRLMQSYRSGDQAADQIFDREKTAQWLAMTDVTAAFHGLIWHNQRFYYNPVLNKLEPIAFDGFTETGSMYWLRRPFAGANLYPGAKGGSSERLVHHILRDSAIMRSYAAALFTYTDPAYLGSRLAGLEGEIQPLESALQEEFPEYVFDPNRIQRHGLKLRQLLFPVSGSTLQAYRHQSGKDLLLLRNRHSLPLEIVGWGRTNRVISGELSAPLWLWHAQKGKPDSLNLPPQAKHLYYRVVGLDSLFNVPIQAWTAPGGATAAQQIRSESWERPDLFRIKGDTVAFISQSAIVSDFVSIPKGYLVHLPAGLKLDFQQGSGFLSHSPILAEGKQNERVQIFSSDSSAKGFTVLQAHGKSQFSYTSFSHFNTLDTLGWTLTGAVSFYESEVTFNSCQFLHNQCEDGLNLVRSPFMLEDCEIAYTFSDGFDADFCTGIVERCNFRHTTNDGMDFSGSDIEVISCKVEHAGDKGISVGEASVVSVDSLWISQSIVGVASKDLSRLSISYLDLTTCQTGLTAYQKKPEYGGAEMTVETLVSQDITYPHLIETGSRLQIAGRMVDGI